MSAIASECPPHVFCLVTCEPDHFRNVADILMWEDKETPNSGPSARDACDQPDVPHQHNQAMSAINACECPLVSSNCPTTFKTLLIFSSEKTKKLQIPGTLRESIRELITPSCGPAAQPKAPRLNHPGPKEQSPCKSLRTRACQGMAKTSTRLRNNEANPRVARLKPASPSLGSPAAASSPELSAPCPLRS